MLFKYSEHLYKLIFIYFRFFGFYNANFLIEAKKINDIN